MRNDLMYDQRLLGAALRGAREWQGISVRELGRGAGLSHSQVLRIESGEFDCKLGSYVRLCGALGLSFSELLERGTVPDFFFYEPVVITELAGPLPGGHQTDPKSKEALKWLAIGACLAVSYILRSANPGRRASSLVYPGEDVQSVFVDFAREMDSLPLSMTQRSALFGGLQSKPISTLKEFMQFPSAQHVRAHALREEKMADGRGVWLPMIPSGQIEVSDGILPEIEYERSKKGLTDVSAYGKYSDVRPLLPELVDKLKKATKQRGRKSALAKFLGVPLTSVSQWLSGDRAPGGETTLRMLHWVELQGRQSK